VTSTLGLALLALVARQAATGYELARSMERPAGFFYAARHSQIYPELARLQDAGLIVGEEIAGAGPRPTRRYRLTDAGADELRRWLATPAAGGPVRDVKTLQFYSLWFLPRDEAIGLVESWRRRHAEALTVYAAERSGIVADGDPTPDTPRFGNLAAVTGGVLGAQADIAWCDWVLDRLRG
jgi:DNA-binding PadR family transcriptional regulator